MGPLPHFAFGNIDSIIYIYNFNIYTKLQFSLNLPNRSHNIEDNIEDNIYMLYTKNTLYIKYVKNTKNNKNKLYILYILYILNNKNTKNKKYKKYTLLNNYIHQNKCKKYTNNGFIME